MGLVLRRVYVQTDSSIHTDIHSVSLAHANFQEETPLCFVWVMCPSLNQSLQPEEYE